MLKYPQFWMDFNGQKNIDFDIQVVQRPNIPGPKRKVNYIEIAGRDGRLTQTDDTYDDIMLKVPLNFIVPHKESFMTKARKAKEWLSGSGILQFSDDSDVFYKVKDASIEGTIERIMRRAGKCSALFVCDPYTYFKSGETKLAPNQCELNPYSLSKPTYHITANSGIGDFTINDYVAEFELIDSDTLVIDTDLLHAYTLGGSTFKLRCDYSKLWFPHGYCRVSSSSAIEIQPKWRTL